MIQTRQISIANKARKSPRRAYFCRRLSHFDTAQTRFNALESAANDYGTTMLGAAEDASLGYLDNAIDEIIGNIIVTLPLWKGEEEYYDDQAKEQEELLDEALTSYYAASAGLSYYLKKVKTILPNGTVQITYIQTPITYGGAKSDLLNTATAVSAVNTSVNNAKGTRTAAVNNAINIAKTANAAVRKTKDVEVEKLYTKVENAAWNTYYVAALTAEKVYSIAYTQTENTFNNTKKAADTTYTTTVVPTWLEYNEKLNEYDTIYLAAIASAGDSDFNPGNYSGGSGANQNYQAITQKNEGGENSKKDPITVDGPIFKSPQTLYERMFGTDYSHYNVVWHHDGKQYIIGKIQPANVLRKPGQAPKNCNLNDPNDPNRIEWEIKDDVKKAIENVNTGSLMNLTDDTAQFKKWLKDNPNAKYGDPNSSQNSNWPSMKSPYGQGDYTGYTMNSWSFSRNWENAFYDKIQTIAMGTTLAYATPEGVQVSASGSSTAPSSTGFIDNEWRDNPRISDSGVYAINKVAKSTSPKGEAVSSAIQFVGAVASNDGIANTKIRARTWEKGNAKFFIFEDQNENPISYSKTNAESKNNIVLINGSELLRSWFGINPDLYKPL